MYTARRGSLPGQVGCDCLVNSEKIGWSGQRDSAKRRYDAIWRHFDAAKTIAEGEAQYGPGTQGLQPKTVELEHVAQQLLALGPIRSPLLEWALVDALIYCECVAFAQTFLSGNTLLGVAVPGELKGVSLSALGWKSLGKSVLGLLSESLKLLATFIFSVVVAQENMQSAWVITTGITAARWLRKAILAHAPNPSQKKHELLARMLNCQHLASGPDFNARLLREHLYKVTTDGAVFSPWVFNILDKRIAVENNLNR